MSVHWLTAHVQNVAVKYQTMTRDPLSDTGSLLFDIDRIIFESRILLLVYRLLFDQSSIRQSTLRSIILTGATYWQTGHLVT